MGADIDGGGDATVGGVYAGPMVGGVGLQGWPAGGGGATGGRTACEVWVGQDQGEDEAEGS